MGFISNLAKQSASKKLPQKTKGRPLWREVFGGEQQPVRPVAGGSYGRSLSSTEASFMRLLMAMRTRAPGGWSDDRWEQSKHFNGIAYVAIHRTNELLTQSEFQVFERDESHPDGKRPVASNHKLVRLLEKPNNEDSFGDLMANWNLQMDLTGMALTWMVPNQFGVPFELYPIPTAIAVPQPVLNPDFPEGYYRIQPVYPYGPFSSHPTPYSAVGASIPAQWMLRFKYTHAYLRYDGYSPMTALRLHMDEVESMDRARWYSMKRSINPSAVLNFEEMEGMQPLPEEEIERIRADFENAHMGPENAGQLLVSTPGAKLEPWGTKPAEMEYQAGWDQLVAFVLGGLGITKPAAGMIEDASYATLFATLKQFYWLTLEPKVDRIAKKLTRHLAPYFGDNLIVEIRCKRLDDHDVNLAMIDRGLQSKAITKNEVRKILNMPITREIWGNEIAGMNPMMVMPPEVMQQMQNSQGGRPADNLNGQLLEEQRMEPGQSTRSRPIPNPLDEGVLGPRGNSLTNGVYKRLKGRLTSQSK